MVDQHPAGTVNFGTQLVGNHLPQRGGRHTSGPDLTERFNGVNLIAAFHLVFHRAIGDVSDHGVQFDRHPDFLQLTLGVPAKPFPERRQHLGCGVEQNDLRIGRIRTPERTSQGTVRHFGNLTS